MQIEQTSNQNAFDCFFFARNDGSMTISETFANSDDFDDDDDDRHLANLSPKLVKGLNLDRTKNRKGKIRTKKF